MEKYETLRPAEQFGKNVFDDRVMRDRLPKEAYRALRKCIDFGLPLEENLADIVANAMKDWAVERGATHFVHWFFPLNGSSAEKHESFIAPVVGGAAIMEFSGKMLIKGESDASSLPSGGLRATFEARGYTMWDPTSPAFLREDRGGVTLCIPTAFCSWRGEALDEKTPLLRSRNGLNKEVLRVLRLFGDLESSRVYLSVGAEQEYFLLDLDLYKKRKDLVLTGRTLFGVRPAKTQELSDHYYAGLNERVAEFMRELDLELWKMGIYAKTKHNEAAPCQHELACIHCIDNVAADQNQLVMETMRRVALRHNLVAVFNEKPFSYINGSGKHNNWSIMTDTGVNLFEPGDNPYDNAKFLLFLCAVIQGVDRHAGLLRATSASASNDNRLGGYEAPPAIISICLGDPMTEVLKNIASDGPSGDMSMRLMDFGVPVLPKVYADYSDRNRTSPFAFTGNKFEFRMPGATQSVTWVNTVLAMITAEALGEFADRLEKADDFDGEIRNIIADVYENHGRIIFNGNGYAHQWVVESGQRGLPNIGSTPQAAPELVSDSTVRLFEKYEVYSREELEARREIMLDLYIKNKIIEANTMVEIARGDIYPTVNRVLSDMAASSMTIKDMGVQLRSQPRRISMIAELMDEMDEASHLLSDYVAQAEAMKDNKEKCADYCADFIVKTMKRLRDAVDALEHVTDRASWPMPTYYDILFNA